MRKKRLLWQLYPAYLLVMLVSLAAVACYASSALRAFCLEQTKADLQARALLTEDLFNSKLAKPDLQQIDALCKELGQKASTRITVILADGRVAGDSDESPQKMDNHADRPEVIAALAGRAGFSERYSYTLKESRLYLAVPLSQDGHVVGALRTSISMNQVDQAVGAIQLRIALGGLAISVLMALVSLWISRRITRPLEHLRIGAKRFAHGNLVHKLPLAGSQEISDLADTLNQMAAELDEKIRDVVRQRNEREAILTSMIEGVLAVDAQERLIRLNQTAARFIGVDPQRAQGRCSRKSSGTSNSSNSWPTCSPRKNPRSTKSSCTTTAAATVIFTPTAPYSATPAKIPPPLVMLHEVTRLKKLEKVRRDFVANVSHELRTPVTSIKGFVETLLDGAMHNPQELQRFLQIVAAQTDRLNAIIEDLLTLCASNKRPKRPKSPLPRARSKPSWQPPSKSAASRPPTKTSKSNSSATINSWPP